MSTRPLSAVSIFSGGGGMDLGIAQAGFATRVTVEIEKYACATLVRAQEAKVEVFPGHRYLDGCTIVNEDLRLVESSRIAHLAQVSEENPIDLLVGGPPCVTFSVAGRRKGLQSDTGLLFQQFVRLLIDLKPRAFLFENVKGLVTAADESGTRGGAYARITGALAQAGYRLSARVVDAADYGVPQHRERLLIVGSREGLAFEFPPPTHVKPGSSDLLVSANLVSEWRTTRDAFNGLPAAVPSGTPPRIPNHVARSHKPATIVSYAATPPGKRNPSLKRDRLEWHRPAKVIRAQGKEKSDGSGQKNSSHQSIHPVEHRQITVRESARIQSFPDWYVFDKTFVNGYRVVGDAVPPRLAKVIATEIRRQLFDQVSADVPVPAALVLATDDASHDQGPLPVAR